ncbi:TolC family protein [Piscinibacter sakaiensis]|uniref:TolC family protein n=1 Tax=Piscinibacter sakaiensis TaxID=1547922 RepID=UPI003AAAFF64
MSNPPARRAPRPRRPLPVRSALLAMLLGMALAAGAAAADTPLTLSDALLAAQQRSRQLQAQDAAAAAAREMAIAAAQRPDPMLQFGISNLPIDGDERFSLTRSGMTMRSIGIRQEFTAEAKRQARGARFDRAAEIARAGALVALAQLQQEAATAWLERHLLDRQVELLREQRAEAALQVDAAEAVYRGGAGSQADLFAARSAVAEIDDRIEQALLDSGSARIRLLRWLGDSANRPLAAPPPLIAARLNETMLERQLERHPQYLLLSRQLAAAEAEVELAQRNKQPDWSAELMLSQRGPAHSNLMSLTVSVPLQWDQPNRQDREVAAALARVDAAQAERDEALRDIVAQTRLMLLGLHHLNERLALHDRSLQPLAASRVEAALTDYRAGNGPLAAVLGARRGLIDLRIERLRLETERARLWARLNYLIPDEDPTVAETKER